jgi:PAS domain S-box-containing protein
MNKLKHSGRHALMYSGTHTKRGRTGTLELRKANAQLEQQILEPTQLTESLNEVNRTLRGLIDSSPLAIIALDRRGWVTMWSKAAERTFGWTEREVLGRPVPYVPHNRERETRAMRLASLDGRSLSVETQRLRKDGSVIDVQITEAPLRGKDGGITSLLVLALDITIRRRLERQVLEASEQEQQRFGRDLHDGLGQQLTGIGFMCETLQQRLVQRGQPEAEAAARIVALVKQAILQTHDMAKGLFPLELVGENRMGIALQNLAMTTENLFRIPCRYHGQPLLQIGDHSKALNLYRIAQEAVHNAVRYSHCTGIDIRLAQKNGQVTLAVQDDGVGIDPGRLREGGMGIHSMTYRANMMGGALDIRRGAHGGTVVTCAVEVSEPKAGAAVADHKGGDGGMKKAVGPPRRGSSRAG